MKNRLKLKKKILNSLNDSPLIKLKVVIKSDTKIKGFTQMITSNYIIRKDDEELLIQSINQNLKEGWYIDNIYYILN